MLQRTKLEVENLPPNEKGNVMRQEYSVEFESFWSIYPRRIAKKAAYKAFHKAMREGAEIGKILSAVAAYTAWLNDGNGWRPEPAHPTTWLNQGRWDDEYEQPKIEKPKVALKLPEEIVKKLRSAGLEDHTIKRWFDDCIFSDGAIIFDKQFVRDYVGNHFDGPLRRAFGSMPELIINSARFLSAG